MVFSDKSYTLQLDTIQNKYLILCCVSSTIFSMITFLTLTFRFGLGQENNTTFKWGRATVYFKSYFITIKIKLFVKIIVVVVALDKYIQLILKHQLKFLNSTYNIYVYINNNINKIHKQYRR